jgi:ADP-heptose:LPS heptosyltransferase
MDGIVADRTKRSSQSQIVVSAMRSRKCEMTSRLLTFKVIQLGDNVVFLPVIQEFAKRGMFASISVWTSPLANPLYDASIPGLNLTTISRARFNSLWKRPHEWCNSVFSIRKSRPTHCLVPEDQGNTAHILALASGAPVRVGYRPDFVKIPRSVNSVVPFPEGRPAPERSWELGRQLATLIGASWSERPPAPDLAHMVVRSIDGGFDFLIHAGASLEYQRWFPERFADLARTLARNHRVGWIDALHPAPDFRGSTVEVVRTPKLANLVTEIAHAGVFIGNNSGPMHLASALGTRSVIINGPSNEAWYPYWNSEKFLLLRDDSLPCIACDSPRGPIGHCTNQASPLACMKFWAADTVAELALDWFHQRKPQPQ